MKIQAPKLMFTQEYFNLHFISLPLIMNHDYEYLFINITQCAFKYTLPTPKAVSPAICPSPQLQ